jgi:hypothetical protein
MPERRSDLAAHHNRETVRWWDLEFAPLLKRLGFKAKTCETILKLTDPEVARYKPHRGGEYLPYSTLKELSNA